MSTKQIVTDLETTLQTLYQLATHLREIRGQWLADNPRDEVDDAYTFGHNPPAGRPTRWDGRIALVESTIPVVREELGFKNASLRGEIERGQACTYCQEPENPRHELTGYDATGSSLRRFSPTCRGRAIAAQVPGSTDA